MKIVVALSLSGNFALYICEAGTDSRKSGGILNGRGFSTCDKDIYNFMTSKFPLSFTEWTHIDLDTEL